MSGHSRRHPPRASQTRPRASSRSAHRPAGQWLCKTTAEMARVQIEEASTGPSPQVLVAASHRKVRIERCDVDREHAKRMVDIDKHACSTGARRGNDSLQFRKDLPCIEN